MPIDYGQTFLRLQASGPLYVAEAWSCTLSFRSASVGRPTQEQVDGAAAAWAALFQPAQGNQIISSVAALRTVKVARIGPNGLYVDPKPTEWASSQPQGLPGGGNTFPAPQVALAVTTEGANPRGAAGRGRFYLPAPFAPVRADGRISADDAQAVGQAAATMIRLCEVALGMEAYIVGSETKTGRGPAAQQIQHVSVGRVLDTIRSRRTSLPEERVYDAAFSGGGGDF